MSQCLGRLLQPYDADLDSLSILTGTGYARRTGTNAWTLDDNYLTLGTHNGTNIHVTVDDVAEEVQFNTGIDDVNNRLIISGTSVFSSIDGIPLDANYGDPIGSYSSKFYWEGVGGGIESIYVYWGNYLGNDCWITAAGAYGSGPPAAPSEVFYYSLDDTGYPWQATTWVRVQTQNTNPITLTNPTVLTGWDAYFSRGLHAETLFGNLAWSHITGTPTTLAGYGVTTPTPVDLGGTGFSSYSQGAIIYASASNALTQLSKNTSATRYLSNTGASNNPAWAQIVLSNGISGFGTGVATALAVNVGSVGATIVNGGVLGTPSSGTVTNLTGTASININGTVGATTPAAVTGTTIISTVVIRLKNYTVATLPSGVQGNTAFCTDLLAPTFLAVAVGGGAIVGPVFYNGTAWVSY